MQAIGEHIFLFRDTCNVYVLKDGNECVLIDFGSGKVLERLSQIGVNRVRAILHTHHHREQCQGDRLAMEQGIPIYVPEKEKTLFQQTDHYWNELFQKEWQCLGVPYVRPLRENIDIAGTLSQGDHLDYGAIRIEVLDTPGHTHGSISFMATIGSQSLAFVGDLIMDGGKLINLFDSEWDYGYAQGLIEMTVSCRKLAEYKLDLVFPSHGVMMYQGRKQLLEFAERLDAMIYKYYLRDYDEQFPDRDSLVPQPLSFIEEVDQVSPHILRWKKQFGNMYIIMSDNKKAVLVDAGIIHYELPKLERESFFDQKMNAVMKHFGIEHIEAVLLTHIHGDHYDIYPFIHKRYGAELWCLENMAEVVEYPERFNLFALLPSYGVYDEAISVDRLLKDWESFQWEGITFRCFHLPGQTYYAMGIEAEIDGVNTVFSGDNLFYSNKRSGHDAFTLRNKAILEEGYLKCAETLIQINPDRLLCGHSIMIEKPKKQIERLYNWAKEFRVVLESFSPYPEYEWIVDPYWLEFYPYRSIVKMSDTQFTIRILIRNHHHVPTRVAGRLCLPSGWRADPAEFEIEISARTVYSVEAEVIFPDTAQKGRYPLTVDLTKDSQDLGEWFEAIVEIVAR